MPEANLKIKDITNHPDGKIISIIGRLDATNINSASEKILSLIDSGFCKLILDFTELEYIGSAGISFLVTCRHKCVKKSGTVCIASANKKVVDIIDTIGLTDLFNFYDTVDEAIEKEIK